MESHVPAGPEVWTRGPVGSAPPPSAASPEVLAAPRQLAWVGTHGGAGTSTLAAVFGGIDLGREWPRPERGEPGSVLLVARTHAAGLQALSRALDTVRTGEHPAGVEVAGAVLVADAPGRLPRDLGRRIKVISSVVAVHRVPWIPAWRTGDLTVPPREAASLSRLTSDTNQLPESKS